MRRFAAFAALVLSVALVAPLSLTTVAALAQTSPQPAPEFRTGTAVVLLDVIARDKKGRPVRDLKAEELQVLENDQRCEIRSFRLVESEGTLEPGAAGAVAAPVAPVEPPAAGGAPAEGQRAPFNLVTLVFDRMSLEDNRLAEKAARDFVEKGMDARTQVAVFTIGTGLGLVQPFTGEKEPLLAAIAAATSGKDLKDRLAHRAGPAGVAGRRPGERPGRGRAARRDRGRDPAVRRADHRSRRSPARRAGGPAGAEVSSSGSPTRCAWRTACSGRWRATGRCIPLLALVKAQAPLAGRKTLVFFSPGLQVPPNLQDVFRTVVSEANRSNVSVYSVDARGLQSRERHQPPPARRCARPRPPR